MNYKKREIVSRPTAGTSALIHEAAHMLLHEGRPDLTSQQKEANAPNYLAYWSTPEGIKKSGERIIKCASQIIEACEKQPKTQPLHSEGLIVDWNRPFF